MRYLRYFALLAVCMFGRSYSRPRTMMITATTIIATTITVMARASLQLRLLFVSPVRMRPIWILGTRFLR